MAADINYFIRVKGASALLCPWNKWWEIIKKSASVQDEKSAPLDDGLRFVKKKADKIMGEIAKVKYKRAISRGWREEGKKFFPLRSRASVCTIFFLQKL